MKGQWIIRILQRCSGGELLSLRAWWLRIQELIVELYIVARGLFLRVLLQLL